MSNTAKADNASKAWDALDSVRDRMQFDLGQIRLPYTVRVQGWKTWMTPLAFFIALCCLVLGYFAYPGFSGSFEASVMDGLILWALTLAGFGAGIVVVIPEEANNLFGGGFFSGGGRRPGGGVGSFGGGRGPGPQSP